eukprot:Platyproteum_vivax@DN3735_c0_g1_i1.p1
MSKRDADDEELTEGQDLVDGRRRWDRSFFAEQARLKGDDDDLDHLLPKKKKLNLVPADARSFLRQRKSDLRLEDKLNKKEVVTTYSSKEHQGGYWCSTCECLIKDSQAWLDHINGRKHNRVLGMSMRVERVGVSKVRERLKQLKNAEGGESVDNIEERLQELRDAEDARRAKRKAKKQKKKEKEEKVQEVTKDEKAEVVEEAGEVDAMASMGLPTGFC